MFIETKYSNFSYINKTEIPEPENIYEIKLFIYKDIYKEKEREIYID